jgi:hypothetical protein
MRSRREISPGRDLVAALLLPHAGGRSPARHSPRRSPKGIQLHAAQASARADADAVQRLGFAGRADPETKPLFYEFARTSR